MNPARDPIPRRLRAAARAAILACLCVAALGGPPGLAASTLPPTDPAGLLAPKQPADSAAALGSHRVAEPADAGAMRRVLVQVEGPDAWQALVAAGAVPRSGEPVDARRLASILDRIDRAQRGPALALADLGGERIATYRLVFNGFLADIAPGSIPSLAAMPGVVGVWPAPRVSPAVRDVSTTMGVPGARAELGFDGRGVTVAVVDTGVDYTHAMLGGSGDPADFAANDETRVEPGSFPTLKVIGGYDLAGTHYSPACADSDPTSARCHRLPDPDDDPLDPAALGHGSHVAGIIAGQAAPPRLPDGIAPGARLVALKIFGNPSGAPTTSDLALSALEWIVGHNLGLSVPGKPPPGRIDVVNLSLGSDWSTGMQAVEAAVAEVVASGVTVVASAGNAGALPYVTGSPGSASMALSVASSMPMGEYDARVEATWRGADGRPASQALEALEGSADWLPRLLDVGRLTGDLVVLGQACGGAPGPTGRLDGAVALIERGDCSFYDKLVLADRLGAVAALVFTDGSPKVVMGCGAPSDCASPPEIPALMLDRAAGVALRDRLLLGETLRVVLEPALREWETDTISDFSSRGPARFDAAIKPQLTAPGSNVSSVLVGSGSRSVVMSGTSMAGPAVAGVAALLWQRSRSEGLDLDAAEVGALLMNYADPLLRIGRADSGPLAPVMRQGAGRVDARAALEGPTLVRSDAGIASLSFGQVQIGDAPRTLARRIQVRNLSALTRRYAPDWRLAFPDEDGAKGLAIRFEPERLELAPGATASLAVSLTLDPARLPDWRLRGAEPIANEALLQAHEIDGFVSLTELDAQGQALGSAENAQLPFHVLPRRRACLGSENSEPVRFWEEGERVAQVWRNPCAQAGRVEVYGLLGLDTSESLDNPRFPGRIDVESVGLRYGPGASGGPESTQLSIVVHTREARRVPADTELRVFLDLDLDGRYDKLIFNAYGQELDARIKPGRWVVAQAPLAAGQWAPDPASASGALSVQIYDLDETTSVLALPAADLGLDFSSGELRFDLAVMALDARADFPIAAGFPGYDQAPDGLRVGQAFRFDQAAWSCLSLLDAADAELLQVGQGVDLAGGSTAQAGFRLNCPVERLSTTMGVLMHYPDNPLDAQVEIRRIEAAVPPPDETPTPSATPSATAAGTPEPTPTRDATAIGPSPTATEAPPGATATATAIGPSPTATDRPPGATASPAASPTDPTRPTATAAGPFAIRSLKVSQAVQLPDGGLPLVAGRPAILRARVDGPAGRRGGGRLYGMRDGQDVFGAPLAPSNTGAAQTLPARTEATDLSDTLNFELPAAWLAPGRLALRLEVLDAEAPNAGISDQRGVEVELRSVPPLEIVLVPLDLQPGGVGPVEAREIDPARDFGLDAALRSFPVARIDLRWHAPLRFVGNLRQAAGRRALLTQLAQLRLSERAATGPPPRLAFVPDFSGPVYLAVLPADQAPEASEAYLGAGVALASEDRPWLAARALALALGLPATDCSDEARADPGWAGGIGVSAEDLLARRTVSGDAFDLMAGCAPAWVSPRSWDALIDRLEAAAPGPAPGAEPPGPVWLVSGRIAASGSAMLEAPWPIDGLAAEPLETGPQPQAESSVRVELEDGAGRRLGGIGFAPAARIDRDGPTGELSFGLILPRWPDARALVLRGATGVELDRIALGAGSGLDLAALLLSPRRSDPRRASLLWLARRDGLAAEPPARLFLRARGVEGAWQSLALAVQDDRLPLTLDSLGLPQGGTLELTAVSGGDAVRQRLALAAQRAQPPRLSIAGSQVQRRQPGEPILLTALGSDRESGPLPAASLRWSIVELGLAATGDWWALPEGLPRGRYTVVVQGRNAAGLFDIAQITLLVGVEPRSGRVWLPSLSGAALPGMFAAEAASEGRPPAP